MKLKDLVKLKPIIEAIEQGKIVQFKNGAEWYSVSGEDLWFSVHALIEDEIKWRIKPEPREWYELEYPDGRGLSSDRYKTIKEAEIMREFICNEKVKIIKVREVIE